MNGRISRTLRAVGVGTVVLAGLAASDTARAQIVIARSSVNVGGGEDGPEAPVTRRGVQRYGEILGLDKDQQDAIAQLFEGYLAAYKANATGMEKAFQAANEKVQESGDFKSMGAEMRKIGKEWMGKMSALDDGFMGDVKSLLTDEQLERWPVLERFRRREQGLRGGVVAGSGLDVLETVRALESGLETSPGVKDSLAAYEAEIDGILRENESLGRRLLDSDTLDFDPTNLEASLKKMEEQMKKVKDHSRAVRDVNRKHARLVSSTLPENVRPRFDEEVRKRWFPSVYRTSGVDRALDAAEGLSDLTPDQKQQLKAVRQGYAQNRGPLDKSWAEAIERSDERDDSPFQISFGEDPTKKPDPLREARKARRELDEQTKQRVLAVLTPDQKGRMPEDKSNEGEGEFGENIRVNFRRSGG
ncbi:MAG: hypothetical protein JNM07_05325 [Phycisphaerae bacterium]|nr:hypothetical protein [Phycisphaerae bacterium]